MATSHTESDDRTTGHECRDHLELLAGDPALPDHIEHHECLICGQWFLIDTETGNVEVDR